MSGPTSSGDTSLLPERYRRELLTDSAIDPAIAAARGYYYESDPAKVRALGFADYQARSGLVIPLWSTAGVQVSFMLKPDRPRVEERTDERTGQTKTKAFKYESIAGRRPMVDAGPNNRDRLRDASIPLVITEGSKKRDAADSRGICCVSINGTWSFMHGRLVIPDFDDINLADRLVYLAFDSDVMKKRSVREALHRLKEALKRRNARVRAIYLPDAPDGSKWGIDDYFANSYTVADFWACARDLPDDDDDLDGCLDEVADHRIAEAEARAAEWEAKYRHLSHVSHAESEILGDSRRKPQERINVYFLVRETERIGQHHVIHHAGAPVVAVDETGAVLASIKNLSAQSGCSPKYYGECLNKWEREGVIERPPVARISTGQDVVDDEGVIRPGYVSICRIRPSGSIDSLRHDFLMSAPAPSLTPRRTPAHRCAEHPDADIIRRTTNECSICHEIVAPETASRHKAGTSFVEQEAQLGERASPLLLLNTPEVISEDRRPEAPLGPAPIVPITTPEVISEDIATRRRRAPDLSRLKTAVAAADHASDREALHRAREAIAEEAVAVADERDRDAFPKPDPFRFKTPVDRWTL